MTTDSGTGVPDGVDAAPGPHIPGGIDAPRSTADATADDTRPEPGSLNLSGRRAWKSWQLVVAILVAALFGMWFNGSTGSASSSTAGGSTGFKPPPAASGATTTTAPGGATTTTTVAGGATTTTVAGGAATTSTVPVVVGPATVLVPATQLTGNWTSPTFNIAGGTWNIGWAFACNPVPAQTPTFAVFVVDAGASPGATPAVTSSAPSGQSVTPQTTTGSQQIIVQSPAGCRWVVKVTGSSS
ncbi:MAG TPA: hypothetical protein VIH95_02630 [Acidimicrobiales bacterium]